MLMLKSTILIAFRKNEEVEHPAVVIIPEKNQPAFIVEA